MNRREFLTIATPAGLGAATLWITGCNSDLPAPAEQDETGPDQLSLIESEINLGIISEAVAKLDQVEINRLNERGLAAVMPIYALVKDLYLTEEFTVGVPYIDTVYRTCAQNVLSTQTPDAALSVHKLVKEWGTLQINRDAIELKALSKTFVYNDTAVDKADAVKYMIHFGRNFNVPFMAWSNTIMPTGNGGFYRHGSEIAVQLGADSDQTTLPVTNIHESIHALDYNWEPIKRYIPFEDYNTWMLMRAAGVMQTSKEWSALELASAVVHKDGMPLLSTLDNVFTDEDWDTMVDMYNYLYSSPNKVPITYSYENLVDRDKLLRAAMQLHWSNNRAQTLASFNEEQLRLHHELLKVSINELFHYYVGPPQRMSGGMIRNRIDAEEVASTSVGRMNLELFKIFIGVFYTGTNSENPSYADIINAAKYDPQALSEIELKYPEWLTEHAELYRGRVDFRYVETSEAAYNEQTGITFTNLQFANSQLQMMLEHETLGQHTLFTDAEDPGSTLYNNLQHNVSTFVLQTTATNIERNSINHLKLLAEITKYCNERHPNHAITVKTGFNGERINFDGYITIKLTNNFDYSSKYLVLFPVLLTPENSHTIWGSSPTGIFISEIQSPPETTQMDVLYSSSWNPFPQVRNN